MVLTKKYVVDLLKDYKRLVLHAQTIENEFDGYLKANVITGMPHGSDLSDPIQQAINKLECERNEINSEIKMVNGWLEYLSEIERFIVVEHYFEELYYFEIAEKWYTQKQKHFTRNFWKRKLDRAILKLVHHTKNPRK